MTTARERIALADAQRGHRLASENDFPYGYPGFVCYIEVRDGEIRQCRQRDALRDAVRRAVSGESVIYAVWPGQHRADLFRVDDLPALARRIKVEL